MKYGCAGAGETCLLYLAGAAVPFFTGNEDDDFVSESCKKNERRKAPIIPVRQLYI